MNTKLLLKRVFNAAPKSVAKAPASVGAKYGHAPHVDWSSLIDSFYNTHYGRSGDDYYGHWVTPEQWARLMPYHPRGQGYFHPSSGVVPGAGACPRAVKFDLLCSPRSPAKFDIDMCKRLDAGTNRHVGLHIVFMGMAHYKWMGVLSYEFEKHLEHPTLPLAGNSDGLVEMLGGWRYVLDFKTKADGPWKKTYYPESKHVSQLKIYQGLSHTTAGYVLYENKNNHQMVTPMANMRVDSDPKFFKEVEDHCVTVIGELEASIIDEWEKPVCDDNYKFCSYTGTCDKQRRGVPLSQLDKRSPSIKRNHLKVIQ